MENHIEIWKDVIGYEGLYQVSSLGNVKSLDRVIKYKNNSIRAFKGIIIKKTTLKIGYLAVNFSINSNFKLKYIHRLVATAFILNPDNKPQVNHINGIKTDNRVENLEWATSKENCVHAFKTGLNKSFWKGKKLSSEIKIKMSNSRKNFLENNIEANRGENAPMSKLKKEQVIEIFKSNLKKTELAKKFNVITQTIFDIKSKVTWKCLNL